MGFGVHAIVLAPMEGAGAPGADGGNVDGGEVVGTAARVVPAVRAVQSAGFTAVVSAGDSSVEEPARSARATVVRPPPELATAAAPAEAALLHALDTVGARDEDVAILVRASARPIDPSELRGAADAVIGGADSAFVASRFDGVVWREGAGGAEGVNHDHRRAAGARDPQWLEVGSIYAMRVGGLRRDGRRLHGRIEIVPAPEGALGAAGAAGAAGGVAWPWPRRPELVISDFDGVMTDDRVWTDQHGTEAVVCSRSDGLGVELLQREIPMVVVSTEENPVVARRCQKLGVDCVQGVGHDKGSAVAELAATHGVSLADVAYVGNDVNDLDPLGMVGYPIAVADAHPRVRDAVGLVLGRPGGRGAIRQLADLLLAHHPTS